MTKRRGAVVATAVIVVVASALAANAWMDRRAEIDRTATAEQAEEREAAQAAAAVERASVLLVATREILVTEHATLGEREADRAAVETMLHATEQQLAELRAHLAGATADLASRTAQLDALEDCVLGVTEALNQAGAFDTGGMTRTLRRIEGTCARAGAAL
jgi:hypothetical protein